jgi:hypothetical protein
MSDQTDTTKTTTKPKRTPEEQQFRSQMERLEGRPLTEQEANLALEQARALGELP